MDWNKFDIKEYEEELKNRDADWARKNTRIMNAIENQLASPDMMIGITNELGIGHYYRQLDTIIDLMEQKKTDDEIVQYGISKADIDDVRELMKLSRWKRASDHKAPPVQGGIGGNVRLNQ